MTTVIPWARVIHASKCGDNKGFCTKCGEEHGGIEPDARKYTCDFCGEDAVYGADELLLMYPEEL